MMPGRGCTSGTERRPLGPGRRFASLVMLGVMIAAGGCAPLHPVSPPPPMRRAVPVVGPQ
jgi:hypothetical protein